MRVFASLILVPASLLAASTALAQSAPAPAPSAQASQPISLYELMGVKPPGLRGAEFDAAVAKAVDVPLGTEKNPVRTKGIAGQRAYFARLRCSDGRPPRILGRHTGMPSPFGGVSDVYGVQCKGAATVAIHMDMYHEHLETRPVPGFTIVAP